MSVFANTQERIKYLSDAIDVVNFAEERERNVIIPLKEELAKLNKKRSWILKALIYTTIGEVVFAILAEILNAVFRENALGYTMLAAAFIAVIVMLVKFDKAIKTNKARKIADIGGKIRAEQAWIDGFYTKNWNSVQHIPSAYRNTESLVVMLNYVQDGRADNLQTAMNLCDAQLHRWRMEDMQNRIVEENRNQSESLRSIRRSSKTTAAASVANVFIKLCK